MLFECLKSPILANGKPIVKDVRLNIPNKNQCRLRFDWVEGGKNIPFDIVVYDLSKPRLEKTSVTMTINGEEYGNHIPFFLKISFSFFGMKWLVNGSIKNRSLNYELHTMVDLMLIVQEMAKYI